MVQLTRRRVPDLHNAAASEMAAYNKRININNFYISMMFYKLLRSFFSRHMVLTF